MGSKIYRFDPGKGKRAKKAPGPRLQAKDDAIPKWRKRLAASARRPEGKASKGSRAETDKQPARAYLSFEAQKLSPPPGHRLLFFSRGQVALLALCAVIFTLGLFVLVHIAQGRNQLGLDVSRLTRERARLLEINGRLKARIERLMVLEDLEIVAKDSLNLQTPRKGQIVELR
ncbi:MAG: hypothetical protein LBO66_07500 [Deltaproteobacteria bacterium]|jgi:hypothetical protein|nr:hypothetical protein [Deltaproteobacteria bacterium]